MKLKRFKNPNTDDISIGILHDEEWLIVKDLLSTLPSNRISDFELLEKVSDNIVEFLKNKEICKKLVMDLIKTSSGLRCSTSKYVDEIIPFEPKSYRDFMLFENHVINATRNYVKSTNPMKYEEIMAYEKNTGQNHEALKPKEIWYEKPIYYMGNHLSFVTNNDEIHWPSYAKVFDYELELGVLIVKPLFNATLEEAKRAIGGFVVLNDFSARNIQMA